MVTPTSDLFCTTKQPQLTTPQDAVLAPLRVLLSKSALRLYLNALLFMGAATLLIGISAIAYGIFYFNFIPTVGLEREVHLQFGYGVAPVPRNQSRY